MARLGNYQHCDFVSCNTEVDEQVSTIRLLSKRTTSTTNGKFTLAGDVFLSYIRLTLHRFRVRLSVLVPMVVANRSRWEAALLGHLSVEPSLTSTLRNLITQKILPLTAPSDRSATLANINRTVDEDFLMLLPFPNGNSYSLDSYIWAYSVGFDPASKLGLKLRDRRSCPCLQRGIRPKYGPLLRQFTTQHYQIPGQLGRGHE